MLGAQRVRKPWLRQLVRKVPQPAVNDWTATRLVEINVGEPIPALEAEGFSTALVLATLHGQPLGTVEVDLTSGPVAAPALATILQRQVGGAVAAHRDLHGCVTDYPAIQSTPPRCLRELQPSGTAPLVSVVVPTRDRADQLATCLHSVLDVDYPNFEVIVVDNAPSDDSTQFLVRRQFANDPRVRYVKESRAGASLARNVGAEAGRGEFVAFTDDDVVVNRLWLKGLVAGFDDPKTAVVTGLTLPARLDTPAQEAFELYGGMGRGYSRRVYDLAQQRGDTLLYPYTAGVFGASNNVAFRRQLFVDRGGFDLSLGPGTPAFAAEDLDAFLSVILDGYQIVYEPRAMLRHDHRQDFADLYWQVFTYSAGLTALLTKWALSDAAVAGDLARRLPRLLPAALVKAHRSGAEAGVGEYPAQLRWLERAGYLYGPIAYLRSRLRGTPAKSRRAVVAGSAAVASKGEGR